jgi:hypothetical protein
MSCKKHAPTVVARVWMGSKPQLANNLRVKHANVHCGWDALHQQAERAAGGVQKGVLHLTVGSVHLTVVHTGQPALRSAKGPRLKLWRRKGILQ